jgi:hypothetical protein
VTNAALHWYTIACFVQPGRARTVKKAVQYSLSHSLLCAGIVYIMKLGYRRNTLAPHLYDMLLCSSALFLQTLQAVLQLCSLLAIGC